MYYDLPSCEGCLCVCVHVWVCVCMSRVLELLEIGMAHFTLSSQHVVYFLAHNRHATNKQILKLVFLILPILFLCIVLKHLLNKTLINFEKVDFFKISKI